MDIFEHSNTIWRIFCAAKTAKLLLDLLRLPVFISEVLHKMSKRANERVESGRFAKQQSTEPSGVSDVPVHFAPLPQDDVLPFNDTDDICVDFNVGEYIR